MPSDEASATGMKPDDPERPWRDAELLRHLYKDKKMAATKIADRWGCSQSTVSKYLDVHGIEKRSLGDAVKLGHGHHPKEVPFQTKADKGTEVWYYTNGPDDKGMVYVHRLLAVAEYGFDAVADSVVHHENEVRWDNRPENLYLMDHGEHSIHHHTKIEWTDKIALTEMHRTTDKTMKELADIYGVNRVTVSKAINEVVPYDERWW